MISHIVSTIPSHVEICINLSSLKPYVLDINWPSKTEFFVKTSRNFLRRFFNFKIKNRRNSMAERAKKWPVFESSNSQENDEFRDDFWIYSIVRKIPSGELKLMSFSS